MKQESKYSIVTVPHVERPKSLEVEITGIPKWKQSVYELVAQLVKIRLNQRLTQQELADKINVKQSVVARFEGLGRIPTIEFLYKVAEGLGVEMLISARVGLNAGLAKESKVHSVRAKKASGMHHPQEGHKLHK